MRITRSIAVHAKCNDWPILRENEHELTGIDPDPVDNADVNVEDVILVTDAQLVDLGDQVNS